MKFVILFEKSGTPEEFQAVVPEHVVYLDQLHEEGVLIAGGPFGDGKGGMLLIDVEDEAAAHKVACADPFVVRGVERYSVHSWEVLTPVRCEMLTRDG